MPTMHYFIDPCLTYFTAKNQIEISFPQLILKTKVLKFLKRMFCLGGFVWGVFGKGDFCAGGFCPGVYVRGGFCLGDFCPRTTSETMTAYQLDLWVILWDYSRKIDLHSYFIVWINADQYPSYSSWKRIVNKKVYKYDKEILLSYASEFSNLTFQFFSLSLLIPSGH